MLLIGVIVEDGGHLILDKVHQITNCSNSGVLAQEGSTIDIKNSIFANNYHGLRVLGNANITNLALNEFTSNRNGVSVRNATSIINLQHPELNFASSNVVGLSVNASNATIGNFLLEDNRTGIYLRNTEILEIQNNTIRGSSSALRGDFCKFDFIDNTIEDCSIGVNVNASSNYSIYNNIIDASSYGALINWATGEIDNNIIGQNSTPGRGLYLIANDCIVQDNIITAEHTGILVDGIFHSTIEYNDLSDARYGIHANGGTTDTEIRYNLIEAQENGIAYTNSGSNSSICNEIEAENAIWIGPNSDQHDIITNALDGDENDILINSELGIQEHNGNVFLGENITAFGLSNSAIQNSVFKVDESDQDLIPDNPNPTELVELETFIGTPKNCDGIAGSRMMQRFLNPEIICAYLQRIERYRTTNPNYYWNRMHHLMRYYLLRISVERWPECITAALNNESMCGLKTIVESEVRLKKLVLEKNTSIALRAKFENLRIEQTNNMNQLECASEISNLWKEVYILMLKRTSGENLTDQDKSILENAATKCASEYGDAVHWARSLLSRTNYIDFQAYDNCTMVSESRSNEVNLINQLVINVSPNPSVDVLNIKSTFGNIKYKVYSNYGNLVSQGQSDSSQFTIDIQDISTGSYILEVMTQNGQKVIEQFIKVK